MNYLPHTPEDVKRALAAIGVETSPRRCKNPSWTFPKASTR
jgi:hypothetical protein